MHSTNVWGFLVSHKLDEYAMNEEKKLRKLQEMEEVENDLIAVVIGNGYLKHSALAGKDCIRCSIKYIWDREWADLKDDLALRYGSSLERGDEGVSVQFFRVFLSLKVEELTKEVKVIHITRSQRSL